MSPGQMLSVQMSPWQLESVLDVPRNLHLQFHQNRVSNSWDIADIEFAVVVVVVVGGGLKSFSCHTQLLSWGWVGVVTLCLFTPWGHFYFSTWVYFDLFGVSVLPGHLSVYLDICPSWPSFLLGHLFPGSYVLLGKAIWLLAGLEKIARRTTGAKGCWSNKAIVKTPT